MRAEIGSEFWDVPTTEQGNGLFPGSTQWFLSGRSALQAIIRDLPGARSVSFPSWCCDSMIKPFLDAGMEVRFYPVYWRGELIQEIDLDCDVLFLMDYFGYTGKKPELSGFPGVVIRDVTHSLFSAPCRDADYYFGSLRKWCGVWTGGYAWTRDGHALAPGDAEDRAYIARREKAMELKKDYIQGRGAADKAYLRVFEEAEEALEGAGVAPAAERDVRLARMLDADGVKSRRRANARVLMDAFSDWLIFPETGDGDCPMFVPVLVPDGKRDGLRRGLIQKEIYCPVHWPVSGYHRLDERTEALYRNELSLVCDQRYSEKDMGRMIDVIRGSMEG